MAPIWLFVDRPWTLDMPAMPVVLAVLGIAAFSTALAYLVYFQILASAGATNLSLVTFLIPVSATGLGVLLLGEVLSLNKVMGFGLIAFGLAAIDGRVWRWAKA
jgi:drug/metabolite transporter (DMT)-like permease